MAKRRQSTLDLNFDSLTDTITNLCGGLILLVVLVAGVSRSKQSGVTALPPPENKVGAESPMDELIDQIQIMQAEAQQIHHDVQRVESELPQLEDEIEQLRRKSEGSS